MRRLFFAFSVPVLACLFLFCGIGCARQADHSPAKVRVYHSGNLTVSEKGKTSNTIYIDIHGNDTAQLASRLESALRQSSFKIVDSPSEAGYILHVTLVREGNVDPLSFPDIVNAGYGSEARFTGSGATAVVTDALLVKRKVPTAKRPVKARLKNISTRNALDNSQMRLGLIADRQLNRPGEMARIFADPLARELKHALVGGNINAALAQ